jgi:hypothetical protein
MHFFRESPWLLEILNDNLEYLIQETGIMRWKSYWFEHYVFTQKKTSISTRIFIIMDYFRGKMLFTINMEGF